MQYSFPPSPYPTFNHYSSSSSSCSSSSSSCSSSSPSSFSFSSTIRFQPAKEGSTCWKLIRTPPHWRLRNLGPGSRNSKKGACVCIVYNSRFYREQHLCVVMLLNGLHTPASSISQKSQNPLFSCDLGQHLCQYCVLMSIARPSSLSH